MLLGRKICDAFIVVTVILVRAQTFVAGKDRTSPCRPGWIPLGNRCLLAGKPLLDCDDASSYCKSLHPKGNLMTIHSKTEQDLVVQILLNSKRKSVWIGLRYGRIRSLEYNYKWNDGRKLSYSRWGHKIDIMTNFERGICVAVNATDGKWYASKEYHRRMPLCVSPALPQTSTKKCSNPYQEFTSKDSHCYLFVEEKKTWQDAENHCISLGSHLVSIKNTGENEHIWLNRALSKLDSFWLGLHSTQGEPFLSWTDLSPAFYWNWGDYEPLNTGNDRCGAFSTQVGKWFVAPCEEKKAFICHHKEGGNLWKIDPAGKGTCPDGDWRDFGGIYCYFYGLDEKIPWLAAQKKCQEMNASLLSIHSEIENQVISRSLEEIGFAWIGIRDTFHSGSVWSDWTSLDYRKEYEYPNRLAASTRCGALRGNGDWSSRGCDDTQTYVCKIKKRN